MSLLHFFERRLNRWLVVVVVVAMTGCASDPARDDPEASAEGDATEIVLPPEALTMYEQAVASMAGGDSVDAELRFQELLLSYPQITGAHVNLAILFAERGDYLAAEAALREALAVKPDHPVALNRLGMVLRQQGRFEDAEDAYLQAIAADPQYAIAHYNLGVLNDLYLRRLGAALQNYETYQSLAGEDAQVQKWIADLKRRIGAEQRTANVTE